MSQMFPMNGGVDSYNKAVEYLKSIGYYQRYANSSQNDGFSIIYAANYQFQKREKELLEAKLKEKNSG